MWNSIYKFGLSDKEIEEINERLWSEETTSTNCPDCNAEPNKKHWLGCDVEKCFVCGGQKIQCNCKTNKYHVWDGMWPGTRACYENKLICCWDDSKDWRFDFNEEARRRISL